MTCATQNKTETGSVFELGLLRFLVAAASVRRSTHV